MTTQQQRELRRLAEAATPGKRVAATNAGYGLGKTDSVFLSTSDVCGDLLASLRVTPRNQNAENDAKFIAVCDRETILALLDRLEEQDKLLERARDAIENLHWPADTYKEVIGVIRDLHKHLKGTKC